MYDDPNKCPACGSKRYTTISATGSEYANLISHDCGSVRLCGCIDCGVVFMDRYDRELCLASIERKNRRKK